VIHLEVIVEIVLAVITVVTVIAVITTNMSMAVLVLEKASLLLEFKSYLGI
jgi:hypothetical protein